MPPCCKRAGGNGAAARQWARRLDSHQRDNCLCSPWPTGHACRRLRVHAAVPAAGTGRQLCCPSQHPRHQCRGAEKSVVCAIWAAGWWAARQQLCRLHAAHLAAFLSGCCWCRCGRMAAPPAVAPPQQHPRSTHRCQGCNRRTHRNACRERARHGAGVRRATKSRAAQGESPPGAARQRCRSGVPAMAPADRPPDAVPSLAPPSFQ